MALTITNNSYNGELLDQVATLISIGSNDTNFFNVATTEGNQVRFTYTDADGAPSVYTSRCAITDDGDRQIEFIDMTLNRFKHQQTPCVDELYASDFANAQPSLHDQSLDTQVVEGWLSRMADKFSKGLQNLRWSGDTTSTVPALAAHDGIIRKIQAKAVFNASSNPDGYQQGTTSAVTAGNVVSRIQEAISSLPFEVTSHSDFKILLAPAVAGLLQQAAMVSTGVNNLSLVNPNLETGLLTENFFGFRVYVANGLGATTANNNVIMAGIFVDSPEGVLKWGVNNPNAEKDVRTFINPDGDSVRMRILASQDVEIIPNVSQVFMNI